MNFSSRRANKPKRSWTELQRELDDKERLVAHNERERHRRDALTKRVCVDDEPDAAKTHAYFDVEIGRRLGAKPRLTRGRLIVELFDDIMPRTVHRFAEVLEANGADATYRSSAVGAIYKGDYCVAGVLNVRHASEEGGSSGAHPRRAREAAYPQASSEANWELPHLNPGILSLVDPRTQRFHITFRGMDELDGKHAVFGKLVYGFDLLKLISELGSATGEPQQPVKFIGGAMIPRGSHPREFLKKLDKPDDSTERVKIMRFDSQYQHRGLIGN